ncbi:MAG TPA: hypothetical protein VFC99_19620 [Acidimicrobiia bacterium]|nr:hypothetical protein [Acidimicrobiia bacterium]
MGTGPFDSDVLATDEWQLRSVDLLLGPAPDLAALFAALVEAMSAAQLVPHTVHCDADRDGYRLHASCDVGTELVTMERILRILRESELDDGVQPAETAA